MGTDSRIGILRRVGEWGWGAGGVCVCVCVCVCVSKLGT